MKYMVMMLDPDGMPRAWGTAKTEREATLEAMRQLVVYKTRKREVGDPLADAKFTKRSEVMP